jgi:hypothetical protein
MTPPASPASDPQAILQSLRRAVNNALERKRRLQHYIVVWADHRPHCIGPDAPIPPAPTNSLPLAD